MVIIAATIKHSWFASVITCSNSIWDPCLLVDFVPVFL